MKFKFLTVIASVLLLSSCVKNIEEEGVNPEFIPHFTYGGYTYYVHPPLGEMTWNDAKKACNKLDGYGYHDWFLPSKGEMDAAHDAGFRWVEGWTSTEYTNAYSYFYYEYDDYYYVNHGYGDYWNWDEADELHIVVPVRRQ